MSTAREIAPGHPPGYSPEAGVTLDAIRAARQRIRNVIYHSPCPYSLALSRICGCEIYCKLDHLQITGSFTVQETTDLALLIRSGSLAAPMEIIEERTIGPSLGQENIDRGFRSTLYGFIAIAAFMIAYYRVFGLVSVLALSVNIMLLTALLSLLQATMTLPGIAAMALALGMAIDANVLINERVREELRNGRPPQQAIAEGYDKAFATILD